MSETTLPVTPATGQPQAETITTSQETVLSRLSQEFGGGEEVKITTPTKTTETATQITEKLEGAEPPVELTAEEKTAIANEAKELGLPETATKAEIDKFKADKESETTWKVDEVVKSAEEESDGTWKGLIESFELGELPADYSEEKGFEVVQDLFNKKLEAIRSEAQTEAKYERFVDVPETMRGEAEMVVELMKTGLTLEKINEPFMNLAAYKALSKEEQVRDSLMNRFKGDEEVVDLKMQKLVEDGILDIEHRAIQLELQEYEERLKQGRQAQIETFKRNQQEVQAKKASQENAKLTHALDGVQEYLGKKLPADLKEKLKQELATDEYRNLSGTPQEKVDYFLYRKFGKTAMKSFQDRALEKVVLENKQNQHNVPILQNGTANRVTPASGNEKSEVKRRLEAEFGTSQ